MFIYRSTLMFSFSDEESVEEKSRTKSSSTKNKTDNSNRQTTNASRPDNKCPICFMIFPTSMAPARQQEHVNEHDADD